jgi:hypothetical protein
MIRNLSHTLLSSILSSLPAAHLFILPLTLTLDSSSLEAPDLPMTFPAIMCFMCAIGCVLGIHSPGWASEGTTLKVFPPDQRIYHQRVDHFSYHLSERTFKQRYWVYDKFWDGQGPILFFFSGEGSVKTYYSDTTVLFSSIGPALHGLIVFLEHRFAHRH